MHIRIYTLFESILLSGTRVRGTYMEQQCGNFYFVFVIIKKVYIPFIQLMEKNIFQISNATCIYWQDTRISSIKIHKNYIMLSCQLGQNTYWYNMPSKYLQELSCLKKKIKETSVQITVTKKTTKY